MDFALSDEQTALAGAERSWLVKNDPLLVRRQTIDDGPARIPGAARAHAAELGAFGLLTSEMGGTHVDLLVLSEEHGRAGSALPVAELAIACRILEEIDHPALDPASSGDALVLPVIDSAESPSLAVTVDGPVLRLRGTTAPASGALDAHQLLVLAATNDGREIAAVVPIESVTVRTLDTLDLTRSWSTVEFALDLGPGEWSPAAPGTADRVRDQLALYRGVDALGATARLLDLTVEYAGQRTQFDRLIGSFQAIKHHCADMSLAVEASRAVLWAGAVALDGDDATARGRAVAAAAAFCGEATAAAAQTALQVHGGIGFTWEHDVHLMIRRIKVDELLDGSVRHQRRRLVPA